MRVTLTLRRGKTDQVLGTKGMIMTVTQAEDDPQRAYAWLPEPFRIVIMLPELIASLEQTANSGEPIQMTIDPETPPEP